MTSLKILSGGAAHGLVEKVRPAFEKETGVAIDGSYGAVGGMKARLLGGEAADVMILSRALIDELVRDGKVVAGSIRDVARVTTAIAVRARDPLPDIGSKDALRAALLAADEIHFPDPALSTAGIHFGKVLKELGVWSAAGGRLRPAPNGTKAMKALANSPAARPIGCTQETEIRAIPGIVVAAPLPPGCELVTTYTAAVTTVANSPKQAGQLIARLAKG